MVEPLDFTELERFLAYLKTSQEGGPAFKGTDGGYLSLLSTKYDDPEAALKSIKRLKECLQSLPRVAERELEACKKKLLPEFYRKGLYSLPPELLAHILGLAYDPEDVSSHQKRDWVSQVNRYFREVTLKVPTLWANVDVETFEPFQLERSRSAPLTITVDVWLAKSDANDRFLNALRSHVWRWKSLSVIASFSDELEDHNSGKYIYLKGFRDVYRDAAFQALESLHVDYGMDYPIVPLNNHTSIVASGDSGPSSSVRNFFSSWKMPSLRRVEAVGFLPVLPSSCQTNLTSFRWELVCCDFPFDLRKVINFLRPLANLERLSFNFLIEGWRNNKTDAAELPNLKVLTIESEFLGRSTEALIDAISAPNLKELNIKTRLVDNSGGVELLDVLFPSDAPRWTELESISCSLEIDCTPDAPPRGRPPFGVLCTRLPSRLRHLTLESNNVDPPQNLLLHEYFDSPHWNRQATLSTLRLINCDRIDTSFIVNLGNVIKAPEFEELEICRCPNINTDFVRSIMPSGKSFKYTPYEWCDETTRFENANRENPSVRNDVFGFYDNPYRPDVASIDSGDSDWEG